MRRPGAPQVVACAQERRWQQLFFFQSLLVAGTSLHWVVYFSLMTTVLSDISLAPLLADGIMLAFHLLVFGMLWHRPAELRRALVLGASLLADTACLALMHPQLQRLWLPQLGMTPGGGPTGAGSEEEDYRFSGPMIYQCLLVYHVLLLLQGNYAVLSSMASIVAYFGLLASGGVAVHVLDLFVVVLPAAISLVAKRSSDELCRQVDALAGELEKRAARDGAAVEAPPRPGGSAQDHGTQTQREEPRAVREVLSRQGSSVSHGEASGSASHAEVASSSVRHETTLSFNISSSDQSNSLHSLQWLRQQQQQPARLGSFKEAAAQTSECSSRRRGPPMREASSQTWIDWQKDGFHCARCAKPPLVPRTPVPSFLRNLSSSTGGSSAGRRAVADSLGSDDSSSEDGGAGGGRRLRFPGLQRTAGRSEQILLLACILAWNVKMRPGVCCTLHAVTGELQRVAASLQASECGSEPFELAYQCLACGACVEMPAERCYWCCSDRMGRTPYRASGAPSPRSL